jgi:putative flippase GtrA
VRRFLLFAVASLLAAGSHYLLMAGLILGLAVPPVMSSSTGVVLGTLVAFLFNHYVTFADADGTWKENGPRWMLVACGVWVTNGVVLKGLLLTGLNVPVSQVLASLVAFVFSFSVNRRFTFRI